MLPPAGEVAEVEGLRKEGVEVEVEEQRKPGGRLHLQVEIGGEGAVSLKGLGTTGSGAIGAMVRGGHIMAKIEHFKCKHYQCYSGQNGQN